MAISAEWWAAHPITSEASDLIRNYRDAAIRQAVFYGHKYPHEDLEPIAMDALYRAAATYRPGRLTFYLWFNDKMRGEMTRLRRKYNRYRHGLRRPGRGSKQELPGPPIRLTYLARGQADFRYYYRDEE